MKINIFHKVKLDIKLILEIILQIVHNLTIKNKITMNNYNTL